MKKLDFDLLQHQLRQGKPGFGKFQLKSDQQFYFKYNDSEGFPLFFSHPHETSNKRDNALKKLKEYLRSPERYKVEKEGSSWLFSVRAGNHQEFARSIPFSSKEKMQTKLSWLQEKFVEAEKKPKKKEKKSSSDHSPQLQSSPPEKLSRFNFDLTFYQQGTDEPLIGKIEYPLKKTKETFEGLDLKQIERFMRQYLPSEKVREEIQSLPEHRPSQAPIRYTTQVLEDGQQVDRYLHLHRTALFSIQLESPEEISIASGGFQAIVRARNFGKPGPGMTIGKSAGSLPSSLNIQIPIHIDNLGSGIYQLSFELSLELGSEARDRITLRGSHTLQILKPWSEVVLNKSSRYSLNA